MSVLCRSVMIKPADSGYLRTSTIPENNEADPDSEETTEIMRRRSIPKIATGRKISFPSVTVSSV